MERYLSLEDNTVISRSLVSVRRGVRNGSIPFSFHVLKDGERLDQLSHSFYGDSTLWWIIAAASDIGWWLQVPPGTVLRIPNPSFVGAR